MFVIKCDNGTYYQRMTQLGPLFGGTEGQAMRFVTREEAAWERNHYGFVCTEIVESGG